MVMLACRWLLVFSCLAAVGCELRPPETITAPAPIAVSEAMGGDAAGFARVTAPRPFVFPRDHGPHPEYKTEWWYFTGNLRNDAGRRFGYQLTIFRIGLVPPGVIAQRASHWATGEIYMGHFAITDVKAKSFRAGERLARSALGLAGAQVQPVAVWIENWRVTGEDDLFPLRISAQDGDSAIDFTLETRKPVVLQGDRGMSVKSATPGNASHYYSYTRLTTQGTLRIDGESHRVEGESWMDREWSTSALEQNQAGWDWFSLQLDDGTELMYYRLRLKDGRIDPVSAGVWIDAAGTPVRLDASAVHASIVREWRSAETQVVYPVAWRLEVPSQALTLAIEPLLDNQELRLTVRYWEGAIRVTGTRQGRALSGYGYLELAGYGN